MKNKETMISWILFGLFLALMIPWNGMIERIKENHQIRIEKIANASTIISQSEELFKRIENNIKGDKYTAEIFVQDVHDLRKTETELMYLKGYLLPIDSIYYEHYMNSLSETSFERLKKIYANDLININYHVGMAREKLGLLPKINNEIFKTIGWWYLYFIPFAFLILCCRLFYSEHYSLKEELILAPENIILASIVWLFGLSLYPDGNPALEKKITSLLQKMFPNKLQWECSESEMLLVNDIATAPLKKVDGIIDDIKEIPETAKTQARTAITITSFLSALCSPIIANASDLITAALYGTKDGNTLALKHDHSEKLWQANASFATSGTSINLLGGPKFLLNNFSFKPEVGIKIGTKDELSFNTGIIGLRIMGENNGVNVWSINKYFLNFKEKAKHLLSQEFALHYFFTNPIAAGIGICNNYEPFAEEKQLNGSLGPRLLFKISKKLPILEIAFGLDFMDKFRPKEVRLMAIFAF